MTVDDLHKMQSWPLEEKVFHTITMIQAFMNRCDELRGRKVNDRKLQSKGFYISFSGGKDSTVLLDIARRFIDPEFPAVFCNTGVEYPEIIKFVKTFDNVDIIHPKIHFKRVLEKEGFPLVSKQVSYCIRRIKHSSSTEEVEKFLSDDKNYALPKRWRYLVNMPFDCSDRCCEFLKKKPFKEYEALYHRYPIIGTTCQESNLRKLTWVREGGCNYYGNLRYISKPLSIWQPEDIFEYNILKKSNLKFVIYTKYYQKVKKEQVVWYVVLMY